MLERLNLQEQLKKLSDEYRISSKKRKGEMLNELARYFGCSRKYLPAKLLDCTAQEVVFGMEVLIKRLPFTVVSEHSDNDYL